MKNELEKAKAEYPSADAKTKKTLEKIFGAENFMPSIQDRIKTFEDAHPIFLKKKFKDKLFLILQKRKVAELTAHEKLMIICNVLQQDWKADYSNSNQAKWRGWFVWNAKTAGFGFSYSVFDYDGSSTGVGSRLCLPSDELCTYFCTQFLSLHNEFLIINQ